ncbi:MAG: hypothetical protein QQW96_02735 [Tychonema bourrellyi B0820]|jgi:hypothetical protein|nr:hypothetical protein [Tychonema bourrellyi B0820]
MREFRRRKFGNGFCNGFNGCLVEGTKKVEGRGIKPFDYAQGTKKEGAIFLLQ